MSGDTPPVFVEKTTYRLRRLADAARLLPILGFAIFLLPLLWKSDQAGAGARTVSVMLYLFLGWIFLAGVAAILSRRLALQENAAPDDSGG